MIRYIGIEEGEACAISSIAIVDVVTSEIYLGEGFYRYVFGDTSHSQRVSELIRFHSSLLLLLHLYLVHHRSIDEQRQRSTAEVIRKDSRQYGKLSSLDSSPIADSLVDVLVRPSPYLSTELMISFFKTLTDQVITVELKNDLSITGTLKSVDQYVSCRQELI